VKLILTGCAGFIGPMVIRHLINDLGFDVVNLDRLTYAGNLESLGQISSSSLF
jgi:dTDP-glucose 4,6-dehydratase